MNLDPYNRHSDEELWKVTEEVCYSQTHPTVALEGVQYRLECVLAEKIDSLCGGRWHLYNGSQSASISRLFPGSSGTR